jgi:hypothetical protein
MSTRGPANGLQPAVLTRYKKCAPYATGPGHAQATVLRQRGARLGQGARRAPRGVAAHAISPTEYYSKRPLHRINPDGSVTSNAPARPAAAYVDGNGHARVHAPEAEHGAAAQEEQQQRRQQQQHTVALAPVEECPTALAPLPDRVPVTFVVPQYVTQ